MVNNENKIRQSLEELGNKVIAHFREVMDSDMGINSKTGTNTLHNSDIYNQIDLKVDPDNGMVNILINSYADYIDMGRMSHSEVATGKFIPMRNCGFPPINILRDWAQRKGIPTDNRTLYKIGYSIAYKGIRPRPVFSYAWKDLDELLPNYLEDLFNTILEDLTDWFNK